MPSKHHQDIDSEKIPTTITIDSMDKAEHHEYFLRSVSSNKFILECHPVTGEHSYLLKVRCKDTKALKHVITDFLKGQCNTSKTLTQIVLSSHKDESLIVD